VAYWVSASKALIKTVSRLKAAGFFSFPISGEGTKAMSQNFDFALCDRRIGQTLVSLPVQAMARP